MKVSVIMPTYNHSATIAQAIESYLMQECSFDTELIISDDASTDGSLEISRKYASEHPDRIILIEKPVNEGLMFNYKTLLENARGEYIAILESDDYWTDARKLQMQVDFLDANAEYNLSFSRVQLKKKNGSVLCTDCASLVEKLSGNLYDYILLRSIIYSPSVVFRRSDFDKYCSIEEYVKRKFVTFDYPTWLSLAAHGKFHYIRNVTAAYRVSESSISNTGALRRRIGFERGVSRTRSYVTGLYGTGSTGMLKIKMREMLIYSRIVWRYIFK